VDTSDIKALYCARSLPGVEEILAETVNFKIQRESEFLRFLLIAVAVGVSEVMETLGYQFQDPGKVRTHQALNQAAIAGNVDHWLERFDVVLRAGYSQGVEQQAACDAFTDQLGALILMFVSNFHVTKCGGSFGGGAALLDGSKLTQSIKEDPYRKKLLRNLENPIKVVAKKNNYAVVDAYLKTIGTELGSLPSITAPTLQYLLHKMGLVYKTSAKVRKNDIFDFFILFSLGHERSSRYRFINLHWPLAARINSFAEKPHADFCHDPA